MLSFYCNPGSAPLLTSLTTVDQLRGRETISVLPATKTWKMLGSWDPGSQSQWLTPKRPLFKDFYTKYATKGRKAPWRRRRRWRRGGVKKKCLKASWRRCYYPNRSRDSLSPVCGIFYLHFLFYVISMLVEFPFECHFHFSDTFMKVTFSFK